MMEERTLNEIYRCPYCGSTAARGDSFCRGCGIKFQSKDIAVMEENTLSPIGALPWNTKDRYKCIHCSQHVSIKDLFCRNCGDEYDENEKHMMRLKISELAKQNTPALIGLMLFVAFVMLLAVTSI